MGNKNQTKLILAALGLLVLGISFTMFMSKGRHGGEATQVTGNSPTSPGATTEQAKTDAGSASNGAIVQETDAESAEKNPNAVHEAVVDESEVTDGETRGVAQGKGAASGSSTGAAATAAGGAVVKGADGKPVVGKMAQGQGATGALTGTATGAAAQGPQTLTVGSDKGLLNGPVHPSLLEGQVAPGDVARTEKPKTDISHSCFTVSYVHKDLSSHKSGEACTHHRNLIKLPYEGVNARSVCIRVNGKAVKFQQVRGKPQEVVIGPIAGPTAKITARFCMNKTTCREDCTVAKDEFMDAIGGTFDETGDSVKVAQWDPSEQNDADVSAEIDPEVKRELASQSDLGLFSGWVNESETPACQMHSTVNVMKGNQNG